MSDSDMYITSIGYFASKVAKFKVYSFEILVLTSLMKMLANCCWAKVKMGKSLGKRIKSEHNFFFVSIEIVASAR